MIQPAAMVLHRSQLQEVPGDDVGLERRAFGLAGARHERGLQADGGGRDQVVAVGGDHADLVRLEAERVDALEVDARVGLVGAGDLGAEDRVPRQLRVLGEVDGLGDVAVRAGRDDVGLLELGEAFDDVGPGIEAVPGRDELVAVGLRRASGPMLARARMSSPIRCSTSRFTHGRLPLRTVSSCGWYSRAPGVGELRRQPEALGLAASSTCASRRTSRTRRTAAPACRIHTDASWRNCSERLAALSLEQKVRLLTGADFWALHAEPADRACARS